MKFAFETYPLEYSQDYVQVNYPNDYDFTRIVEIKHVTKQKTPLTTIEKEYPCDERTGGEICYPIPNRKNHELYRKYEKEAKKLKKVYFTGRLARYKYLNMDQVVLEAIKLSKKI